MKKRLFSILTAIAAAAALCCPAAAATLSWTEDPATSMTVTWRSDASGEQTLQLVAEDDFEAHGFAGAREERVYGRDISPDGNGAYHYEVTVRGLTPGERYVCRVGDNNGWSGELRFRTDDPLARSVTFAYFGDAQPGGSAGYEGFAALAESVYTAHPELSFAMMGGDMVNSGVSPAQFDAFSAAVESAMPGLPLFAVNGNHESNYPGGKPELYLDIFALPRNGPKGFTEEMYSFDAGNVHIVAVNSWVFSGEQKLTEEDYDRLSEWLKNDLASSTADWQIVVTHIPVQAVHSDMTAERLKEAWGPILEDYGVDLVLEGHQHVYSRSVPLYRGKTDYENGITYIMGVSGSKFYSSSDETRAARVVYNTANCQIIRSDDMTLSVQTVDADGNEMDYISLPQRTGAQTRLAYVTRLWMAAGSPQAGESPFADTDSPAMAWAAEAGIIEGYGNGIAGPDDLITDWQIALIDARMNGDNK